MTANPLHRPFSLVLLAFLSCLADGANAGIKQCERLTPDQQTQADFCETHVACRVAISLLTNCADATTALRRFHDELNAPHSIRPEPADTDDSIATIDTETVDRDEIRQFQADDRMLENEMLDANCTKSALVELAQCDLLGKKAFELKQRLDHFERDAASHRAPHDLPLVMPVLRSWTKIRTDSDGAISYIMDGASASAASAEVAAPSPLAPTPAMRPRGAVDTFFKEALASADAEAKSLVQLEAIERAGANAAAAASDESALAETQQTMLTGGVGEVFALADRLESEKQLAAAREAFRAVIARFPNHSLASSAATRLSAMSATSSASVANRQRDENPPGRIAPKVPADCEFQSSALNAELARLKARKPANASSVTMLQMVMYISSKSLQIGKGVCSGNRREPELTRGMQAVFDDAKRTCVNISANANTGACVARAPAWK